MRYHDWTLTFLTFGEVADSHRFATREKAEEFARTWIKRHDAMQTKRTAVETVWVSSTMDAAIIIEHMPEGR